MKLKITHVSNDFSLKLASLAAEATAVNFGAGDMEIEFHKPLKSIYVELVSRSETDTISLQYFNGSAFVPVPGFEDYTLGLTKSGYINIPEEVNQVAISGKFKLKLNTVNTTEVQIRGIGLVLSCDDDFRNVPNIADYLADGDSSFIRWHEEATNLIVQDLRCSGKRIVRRDNAGSAQYLNARNIEVWDLLDLEEFRLASKYLALSLLFEHLSKSNEDHYAVKASRFHGLYNKNFNLNLMTIDNNDDGKTDPSEAAAVDFIRIIRE